MSKVLDASPLGKTTQYISQYTPALLCPIARESVRQSIGIDAKNLPFKGVDIWTGFEISWLNLQGLPQVAVAEFRVPCESPAIIESKSFKLYLNSFNQSKFSDKEQVCELLVKDLSQVAGVAVGVSLYFLDEIPASIVCQDFTHKPFSAKLIDKQNISIEGYHPTPEYLTALREKHVSERLCSNLLKTNCPVTSQPDWASLLIEYQGPTIDREGLLRYIVSFREHQDFHEHCVERIFCDILHYCKPEKLSVYARYTRRGGLDINPFRSNYASRPLAGRLWRQ